MKPIVLIIGVVLLLIGVGIVALQMNLVPASMLGVNDTSGMLPADVSGIPMVAIGGILALVGIVVAWRGVVMY